MKNEYSLRPIVSIDLDESGYSLEKVEDKDKGTFFKLTQN